MSPNIPILIDKQLMGNCNFMSLFARSIFLAKLIFLCLIFLIYNMGILRMPTTQTCEDLKRKYLKGPRIYDVLSKQFLKICPGQCCSVHWRVIPYTKRWPVQFQVRAQTQECGWQPIQCFFSSLPPSLSLFLSLRSIKKKKLIQEKLNTLLYCKYYMFGLNVIIKYM